jgi:hypothetical protein
VQRRGAAGAGEVDEDEVATTADVGERSVGEVGERRRALARAAGQHEEWVGRRG